VYSGITNKANAMTGTNYIFSANDTAAVGGYVETDNATASFPIVSGGKSDNDKNGAIAEPTPEGAYFDRVMVPCAISTNKALDSERFGGPDNSYLQLNIKSPAGAVGDAEHQVPSAWDPDLSPEN
jgi:hypothetical protein